MHILFKISKQIIVSVLLLCSFTIAFGQGLNDATVVTTLMPPYNAPLSQFESQIIVNVMNTSQSNAYGGAFLKVYIEGLDNGIVIQSIDNINPNPFDINEQEVVMRQGTAGDFSQVFEVDNLSFSGISENQVSNSGLPFGSYQICFRLFSNDNEPLSLEGTGCILFTINAVEPPQLIAPFCGDDIVTGNNNIVFSWTTPPGASPSTIEYTLKMVELLPNQDPNQAFLSSTVPAFFERSVFTQTSILYGPTDPPLEAGKSYAWQVIASEGETNTPFLNDGKSEVCWFTWKPNTFGVIALVDGPEPSKTGSNQPTFTPDMTAKPLHFNTFKGKIVYAFRSSETGLDKIQGNANLSATQSFQVSSAPVFSTDPGNTNGNNRTLPGSFSTSGPTEVFAVPANVAINKSNQEKKQDKINKIIGGTKFPLVDTPVSVYMYLDEVIFNLYGNAGLHIHEKRMLIGKGITNSNGEFAITYFGDLQQGKSLDIVIENKHFEFSVFQIPINTKFDGTYDIGTLVGVAKTFRSKLKATDEDGNNLENIVFKIYRSKGFYNGGPIRKNTQYEGNREKDKPSSGSGNENLRALDELVAEGNTDVIFSRLFFSLDWGEHYIIRAYLDGKQVKQLKSLNFDGQSSYLDEGVLLFKKTIVIPLPNPVVEGRIVIKGSDGIPAIGAKVFIKSSKEGAGFKGKPKPNYTTITDSLGHFKLENLEAMKEPYQLEVTYQKNEFVPKKNISLNKKGLVLDLGNIEIEGHLEKVCGQVVDEENNTIIGAVLRWKSGGNEFYSDNQGNFTTSQAPGKHILLAKMNGFRNKEFTITVGTDPSPNFITVDPSNFQFKNESNASPNKFQGYATIGMAQDGQFENGVTYQQAGFQRIFGTGSLVNANNNAKCDHILKMSKFYVQLTIKDSDTQKPISEAQAKSESASVFEVANKDGIVVLGNIDLGTPNLIVAGPKNSTYINISAPIEIGNMAKDTVALDIFIEKGIEISGKVLAASNAIENATVFVKGKEHIATTTDGNGKYLLGIPAGNFEIVAQKTGYVADVKQDNFVKGKSYKLDFNLNKPEFNAEKLMGYTMVLDDYKAIGANEYSISGALENIGFVNGIKPKNQNQKLVFSNVKIRKVGNTIEPIDAEVNLNTSNIELLIHQYVKAVAYNANGLQLKPINGDKQKGAIVSEVKIDLKKSFPSLNGLELSNATIFLKANNSKTIEISKSDGNSATINYGLDAGSVSWKLFGFEMQPDFSNASINENELTMAASLKVTSIPGIDPFSIKIKNLTITKSGSIKDLAVDSNFAMDFSSWKMKISNLKINSYGISLAGNMDVAIPGSALGSVGVTNLMVKTTGIAGGEFYFPNAGLNIYDAVRVKSNNNQAFALQKIPASNHYELAGGALLQLPKYISEKVTLPFFSVATNGNFGFKVKPDLSVDFAKMAKFEINNLGFKSTSKELEVGGKMKLDIPNFGVGAGTNLHYSKSSVSVDEIGFEYNLMSSVAMAAKVKFSNDEFKGDGSLKLANMDAGIGLSFHYRKVAGGKDIGALFKTDAVIPIGIVKLDQIGGGFNVNTSTNIYYIFVNGRILFAADPGGVVALNPVKVQITSTPKGPIFEGSADVVLMDSWKVGKGSFKLDFADQYYYVDAKMGTGVQLMKGVNFSSTGNLRLELSTKSNNTYWFVSATTETSIAKIFKVGVNVVGGWNVSKAQHASLVSVPDFALHNGRVYGGYFNAYSNLSSDIILGVKGIAEVYGSVYNKSDATVFANIKAGSYGIQFENGFGGSLKASFFDIGVAGASLSVNSGYGGWYKSGTWDISGNLGANLNAHIGCNGGCNGITWGGCFDPCFWSSCEVCPIPCGAKICVKPNLLVSYNSNSGIKFKLDL